MDRLAMTGLALAVGGAAGILILETIGTAHAGRADGRDYVIAVGVASPVRLVAQSGDPLAFQRGLHYRTLVCRGGVLGVGSLSVGFRCAGN
jgi:hypothetical protein